MLNQSNFVVALILCSSKINFIIILQFTSWSTNWSPFLRFHAFLSSINVVSPSQLTFHDLFTLNTAGELAIEYRPVT
jgi:hypothetical protein